MCWLKKICGDGVRGVVLAVVAVAEVAAAAEVVAVADVPAVVEVVVEVPDGVVVTTVVNVPVVADVAVVTGLAVVAEVANVTTGGLSSGASSESDDSRVLSSDAYLLAW